MAMPMRNVSRFYLAYDTAAQAVADLIAAGVPEGDISLIQSEDDRRLPPEIARDDAQPPALVGAKLGGGIGGGGGGLLGIGAVAIPGLEALAEAGWFLDLLVGAVVGALLGAVTGIVTGMGVSTRHAHRFAEGLQRGRPLVLVRTDDANAERIEAVLARNHPSIAPGVSTPTPVTPATVMEERAAIHRDQESIQHGGK